MGLGARLKNILAQEGKTIAWLSEQTNIPKNSLYTIIKRDNTLPRTETIKKIAKALNVSIASLMFETEMRNNVMEDAPGTTNEVTDHLSESISKAIDGVNIAHAFIFLKAAGYHFSNVFDEHTNCDMVDIIKDHKVKVRITNDDLLEIAINGEKYIDIEIERLIRKYHSAQPNHKNEHLQ